MYRIFGQAGEVRERRHQLRHPKYQKPQLLATQPNQVWSWDITKLLGPVKWAYFYLYVLLDIFSRYVVGWMVADRESAELAKRLIAETCRKQSIAPGQLTLRADRGTSMRSKPLALLRASQTDKLRNSVVDSTMRPPSGNWPQPASGRSPIRNLPSLPARCPTKPSCETNSSG
jgi:transposase InsO family protein